MGSGGRGERPEWWKYRQSNATDIGGIRKFTVSGGQVPESWRFRGTLGWDGGQSAMNALLRLVAASILASVYATAHAAPVTPQLPDAITGLWWNSSESGWGIHLTQRKDVVFASWYTYDGVGAPRWLVASDCRMSAVPPCSTCVANSVCSGTLYEVNGPRFFNQAFDPSTVHPTPVGSLSFAFQDADHATMSYQVGNLNRTLPVTRQIFRGGFTPPPVNYTDLWWNAAESGWGLAITQQYDVMFLAWFVYEHTGRPVWYVVSNCAVNAARDGCSGPLYITDGPPGPPVTSTFDPSKVNVTGIGSVSLLFSDANNGVLRYHVDGRSGDAEPSDGSKAITRKLF